MKAITSSFSSYGNIVFFLYSETEKPSIGLFNIELDSG